MINPDLAGCNDDVWNFTLFDIEKQLVAGGKKLEDFGLPSTRSDDTGILNKEIGLERAYNRQSLQEMVEDRLPKLTPDQRTAYDKVMHVLYSGENGSQENDGHMMFLNAPGGTGNTWLLNTILASVKLRGDIALAVASSGIAALLIDGGRTAHSRFRIPLNLKASDTPRYKLDKSSDVGALLRQTKLIIWDECTIMNKKGYEALDGR